jgi:hypothetical protein
VIVHAGANMKIDESFHGCPIAVELAGVYILCHGLFCMCDGRREALDTAAKGAKMIEVIREAGDLAEWGFVTLSMWKKVGINTEKVVECVLPAAVREIGANEHGSDDSVLVGCVLGGGEGTSGIQEAAI